jgi:hypothetical protein
MSEIIDFGKAKEERKPYASGHCYCMACNHEWLAVWPIGTIEMECPECKSMRGRSKYDYGLPDGTHVWSCQLCGNQLFNLLPDRVHCPGCGCQWDYGDIV